MHLTQEQLTSRTSVRDHLHYKYLLFLNQFIYSYAFIDSDVSMRPLYRLFEECTDKTDTAWCFLKARWQAEIGTFTHNVVFHPGLHIHMYLA